MIMKRENYKRFNNNNNDTKKYKENRQHRKASNNLGTCSLIRYTYLLDERKKEGKSCWLKGNMFIVNIFAWMNAACRLTVALNVSRYKNDIFVNFIFFFFSCVLLCGCYLTVCTRNKYDLGLSGYSGFSHVKCEHT